MANPRGEITLQQGVHHLLSDTDGVPYAGTESTPTFTIWNCIDQSVFEVPSDAQTRAFSGVCSPIPETEHMTTETEPVTVDTEPVTAEVEPTFRETAPTTLTLAQKFGVCEPGEPYRNADYSHEHPNPVLQNSVLKPAASWKDDQAVKHLIKTWKDHDSLFKSATMQNEQVWRLITKEISAANSTWIYSGTQCENKFKDVRKGYVKVRDHNNQTGAEAKTCKFFDEMEEVLGDKPCVTPVALASNLKKRVPNTVSCYRNDECSDNENIDNTGKKQKNKKTRVQKELAEWNEALRADGRKREEAREKRHTEGMNTFKEVLTKLIDKL